jgi:hypothetical protein
MSRRRGRSWPYIGGNELTFTFGTDNAFYSGYDFCTIFVHFHFAGATHSVAIQYWK